MQDENRMFEPQVMLEVFHLDAELQGLQNKSEQIIHCLNSLSSMTTKRMKAKRIQ